MSKAAFILDNFGDHYNLRAFSEQTGKIIECTARVYEDCSIAQQISLVKIMLEALEAKLYHEALENHVEHLEEKKQLEKYRAIYRDRETNEEK